MLNTETHKSNTRIIHKMDSSKQDFNIDFNLTIMSLHTLALN